MKEELLAKASKAKTLCLLSLAALVILFVWQTLIVWDKPIEVRISVWTVQLLPFLLVLRGLMIGRWRSYAWMLFFLNLYIVWITLKLMQEPGTASYWFSLLSLGTLFTAALLFVRWTRIAESYGD